MSADPTPACYRGRFAPSPTGDLHLGSAATAIVAWLRARASGGAFVLRVEDTDRPRIVAGSEASQLEDLRWLGLDWDEGPDIGGPFGPYRQSERGARYEAALRDLDTQGLLYLCDCSRREIAGIASAPHPGEEGPRYPGTCRKFGTRPRPWKRPPALRLALPDREIRVRDAFQGEIRQNVWREVGDFVVKRGDGVYAYQLAVVVDDLEMHVTEVVRGADLLGSAPRQALLAEMFGARAPGFAHVPLVVDATGNRLEKRNPAQTLHGQRRMGCNSGTVVAQLLAALGLSDSVEPAGRSMREIARTVDFSALCGRRELRLAK